MIVRWCSLFETRKEFRTCAIGIRSIPKRTLKAFFSKTKMVAWIFLLLRLAPWYFLWGAALSYQISSYGRSSFLLTFIVHILVFFKGNTRAGTLKIIGYHQLVANLWWESHFIWLRSLKLSTCHIIPLDHRPCIILRQLFVKLVDAWNYVPLGMNTPRAFGALIAFMRVAVAALVA